MTIYMIQVIQYGYGAHMLSSTFPLVKGTVEMWKVELLSFECIIYFEY